MRPPIARGSVGWLPIFVWYHRHPTKRHPVTHAVVFWFLVRAVQLVVLGWGTGSDPEWYRHYAQQWLSGDLYRASQPEYPPGAFPIFLWPLLAGGAARYRLLFATEMACFDVAACVLIVKCAAMHGRSSRQAVHVAMLFTVATAALYPILYTRYDLVPTTLVLAALYCQHRQRLPASAALLGAAAAVKLWPLALAPLWFAWNARRNGARRALLVGLWIAAGALLASLPVLPLARSNALSFVRFYAERGLQVESTWATVALAFGQFGLASARSTFEFGAFQVVGRVPSLLGALSLPLTIVLVLLPQVLAIAHWRRPQPDPDDGRSLDTAALAVTIALLITGKVLSPQFMVWAVPLLALAADSRADVFSILAMVVLTTVAYPFLSPALEQRAPGHGWALLVVTSRNVMLVGWYCVAVGRQGALDDHRRTDNMRADANR